MKKSLLIVSLMAVALAACSKKEEAAPVAPAAVEAPAATTDAAATTPAATDAAATK